ncbi:MAG: hypothetical protein EBU66_20775 [Bacteroidetes bacterium]|nr:hypothetical protein [Bacteroidota bacterium]
MVKNNRYENLQYLDVKSHMHKTRSDNVDMHLKIALSRCRRVEGIHKDGTIKTFDSIKEACIFLDKNNMLYETII